MSANHPTIPLLPRKWARLVFHGTLLTAFAVAGGSLLVWPQWIGLEGSRLALEAQKEREDEYSQRLESVRMLNQRLRTWKREGRRVLLEDEARRLPKLVAEVARREGSSLLNVTVTGQRPARWKSVSLDNPNPDDEAAALAAAPTGEIQPRLVRVVLKGDFNQVYKTVTSLCQQQQLFIPERWDLLPTGSKHAETGAPTLRAEVWGSVFLIRQPEESSAPVGGPVAAVPGGNQG